MTRFKLVLLISALTVVLALGTSSAARAVEVVLTPPPESPYQGASGVLSVTYYGPYTGVDSRGKRYKYYNFDITGVVTGLPFVADPAYYILDGYQPFSKGPGGGSGASVQIQAHVWPRGIVTFNVDPDSGTAQFSAWGQVQYSEFAGFEVWIMNYQGYATSLMVLSSK